MPRVVDFQKEKERVLDSRRLKRDKAKQARSHRRRQVIGGALRRGATGTIRWSAIVGTGFLTKALVFFYRLVAWFIGSIAVCLLMGVAFYYFFPETPDWEGMGRMSIGLALCGAVYGGYLAIIYALSFANEKLKLPQQKEAA
ncbi:hypothetical protein [Salinicola sp. NYA28a]